jgi:hypothetical protein
MVHFDHIEIHVKNSHLYCEFLTKLFSGGRYKKISENNIYMFLTHDNLRFEIKESQEYFKNFNLNEGAGICLPCLRKKGALEHLNSLGNIEIKKTINNPDGDCIFFKDYEGIDWHIKDYDILDMFTNI